MQTFNNLETLKNFLLRDKENTSLNPIRLINVNSISAWQEMKKFLSSVSEEIIFLSEFCTGADTTPNLKKLYSALQNIKKSVCVLPLSEYLRLQPESAVKEIHTILNIKVPDANKYRIYFLLYRLQSVLLSTKINDPRKNNCVILSDTASNDNYSLTIVQQQMRVNISGNCAEGFKKYLAYWEDSPLKSLCLYTANAVHFQDKKFFDDVKIIANSFDLLRHYYNLPENLEKIFGTNENWEKLAVIVSESKNFEKALCKEFSSDNFNLRLFENWNAQNIFRRWLLWIWCKVQNSNSYAVLCAKNSNSVEDFTEKIFSSIFEYAEYKNFDVVYNERKLILSLLKIPAPQNFIEKVQQTDKKISLKVLTDNSTQEKILIFETLRRFKISEYDKILKLLKKIYPDLANYLADSVECMTDEQKNYFRQYRRLKVADNLTAEFAEKVFEIAERKGEDVYKFLSRTQIIDNEYTNFAAIYFVDAMGVEYLNYFLENFSAPDKKFSVRYQIGYCNLPSITQINKDFLQGKNIAGETVELDEIKHLNFNYPENLIKELDFLATLKEKILIALDKFKKIIICADHGTSRLAVIARKNFDKVYSAEGRKIYNCGRYADALPNDEEKFSAAVCFNEKIIFADYSRFSQSGSPGNEIHGGATFEEWLVPIIIIEKITNAKKISTTKKRGIKDNAKFHF